MMLLVEVFAAISPIIQAVAEIVMALALSGLFVIQLIRLIRDAKS